MIFILQCIMMIIGLGIFVLQHRVKRNMSIVASRLVYWTTLLFIGITFNRILFEIYPKNYHLITYYTKENLILIASIVGTCIVLQLASPSLTTFKKMRVRRRLQSARYGREEQGVFTTEMNQDHNSCYLKEHQFETFLETICWIGFALTMAIQAINVVEHYLLKDIVIYDGIIATTCLVMLLSMPIAIRQIIFYLGRIRTMKDEDNIPEIEVKFQKKLRKENHCL